MKFVFKSLKKEVILSWKSLLNHRFLYEPSSDTQRKIFSESSFS